MIDQLPNLNTSHHRKIVEANTQTHSQAINFALVESHQS